MSTSENPAFVLEEILSKYPDISVFRDKFGEILIFKKVENKTYLSLSLFPSRKSPDQLRLGLTIAAQEEQGGKQSEYTHIELHPSDGEIDKNTSNPHPNYPDTLIIETAKQGLELFDAYSQVPKTEAFRRTAFDKNYDRRVSSEGLYKQTSFFAESSLAWLLIKGASEKLSDMGISPVEFYPSPEENYKSALLLLRKYLASTRNELSEQQIDGEHQIDLIVSRALLAIFLQFEQTYQAAKVAERRKVLPEKHELALRGLVQPLWNGSERGKQVYGTPLVIANRFNGISEAELLDLDSSSLGGDTFDLVKRNDLLWELTDMGFATFEAIGQARCLIKISKEGLAILDLELVERPE